jgi:hypothetical protein
MILLKRLHEFISDILPGYKKTDSLRRGDYIFFNGVFIESKLRFAMDVTLLGYYKENIDSLAINVILLKMMFITVVVTDCRGVTVLPFF